MMCFVIFLLDEIKRRFDEKSLFPKYILDYHNKMKVSSQFIKQGDKHAKNRRQSTRNVSHSNNVHFASGVNDQNNYQDSKYDLNGSNEFSRVVLNAKNAFLASSRQSKTSQAAFRRNNKSSRATQRLKTGFAIRDNVFY